MVGGRTGRVVEELAVRPDDLGPLVEVALDLRSRRAGWLHLQPAVPEEAVPPPPRGLALLLAGQDLGPAALGTWVPGPLRRGAIGRRRPVDQLGVQHGLAARARPVLATAALWPLPPGWILRQDDARRGLVVEVPEELPLESVFHWLLAAVEALSSVPLSGSWRALVFRRAAR
jgi:hypothetical protein